MKTQDELLIIKVARQCIRCSLIGGTLIFMAFALTRQQLFIIMGFIFILTSIAANGIVLLILLLHLAGAKEHQKKILRIIVLMLLNIPIAILYGWLTSQIAQIFNLNL